MKQRNITEVRRPHSHQGFLGEGHEARAVIDGTDFTHTDPFILLMDDRLNLPGGKPAGGPHPHAGFETVTLVIKGDERDWHSGSMELMTAGSGIIHTEEISTRTDLHILQLWLALPPQKRWTKPFWQQLLLEDAPTLKNEDREIRVYSGDSNGLHAPVQNHTAFTLVDITLKPGADVTQYLPAGYNGFIYVLEGTVLNDATRRVSEGESGWMDQAADNEESELRLQAGEQGARFVLYAARPHGVPIVNHGPFIGDTRDDLVRLYKEYQSGKIIHLHDLPEDSKIRHRTV